MTFMYLTLCFVFMYMDADVVTLKYKVAFISTGDSCSLLSLLDLDLENDLAEILQSTNVIGFL